MDRDYITLHILDTVKGSPASGVNCVLSRLENDEERLISTAVTNADGRIAQWKTRVASVEPGNYKIRFETGDYLRTSSGTAFFPVVDVVFAVSSPPDPHYHIPLLLSNFSYSTYRGS